MEDAELSGYRITAGRDDVALSVVDFGGDGPSVLLLHGLAGRATEWRTTARWLRRDFHVLALDQRGHGESAKGCGDFSRAAYVDDIAAVVQTLKFAPVILVGQSMGALNAYLVAARYPHLVRGLVLIEAGLTNDESAPEKIRRWLDSWPVPFPDVDAARRFFGGDSLAARTWVEVLVETSDGLRPEFRRDDIIASVRDYESESTYENAWRCVTCPALLVLGENGWISGLDVERMRSSRLNLTVVTVQRAGHDVHLDNPDEWRDAAERFLRQFRTRRRATPSAAHNAPAEPRPTLAE